MPRHLHVACAIIERDGLILAARRRPGLSMAGKWEFPGGKIQDGETAADALRRELREELEVEVEILAALPTHTHHYPGIARLQPGSDPELPGWNPALPAFTVTLYPFRCRLVPGSTADLISTDHDAFAWLPPDRLTELDWAEADAPIIQGIKI
jgi:8-oxo-dGTP diphosphatase